MLQGSRRALPPVGTIGQQRFERLAGVSAHFLPAGVRVREQRRGGDLAFGIRVVFEKANHRRRFPGAIPRGQPGRRFPHPSQPFGCRQAVALVQRALHESGDDQGELAMQVGRQRAAFRKLVGGELRDQVFERPPVSEEAEVGEGARGQ